MITLLIIGMFTILSIFWYRVFQIFLAFRKPRNIEYLKYVVRHKKGVYIQGRKLGLDIFRLLLHDWDKFMPGMFIAYAHTFYTEDGESQYSPHPMFNYWWLRHQQRNKHHYQNMILINDDGTIIALRMQLIDITEMLADWQGVSYAFGKENPAQSTIIWYEKSKAAKRIHPETRIRLEQLMGISGVFEEREIDEN